MTDYLPAMEGGFEFELACRGCAGLIPVEVSFRVAGGFRLLVLEGIECPACGSLHSVRLDPYATAPAEGLAN